VAFALVFLLVAVLGLVVFVVATFNPKNLAARLYQFDKKVSHVGPLRFGIFLLSEDRTVHRVCAAGMGAFLAVLGVFVFVSLI
jgi:hypothetical protein